MDEMELFENGEHLAVVIGSSMLEELKVDGCSILSIPVRESQWNHDMSPWEADPLFPNGDPFTGGAECFFEKLEEDLDPVLASHSGMHILMGYSLAGLFSLYICTLTDRFDSCASVSGSLWYPGWTSYLETHPLQCRHCYLSLGDREKNAKHPLMKTVETATVSTEHLLKPYCDCVFELNPGTHFGPEGERLNKALQWLLSRPH
ncbi:MAG: hypothetical protein IJ225_01905 [Solobacterium sp.]|nr:hypothetical protein [Solobacterium sp.]